MIVSHVLQRLMLSTLIARVGTQLGLSTRDVDRAATMAREATRDRLAHVWLTRLRDGSHVLLDFNDNMDLATAMRLHESGEVEVSERLSEIVDEAREALAGALQTDEMMRTTNKSY